MEQDHTIKLPSAVLSGLFRNSLVDLASPKSASPDPLPINRETETKMQIGTLVVADANGEKLEQQQLSFLHAIMKACKINTERYSILTNKAPLYKDYQSMHDHFKQKELILFGIEPAAIGLPIHFPHFQVQAFQEVKYLSAPPLEMIEADKTLKMQLWQCLQQLYPG